MKTFFKIFIPFFIVFTLGFGAFTHFVLKDEPKTEEQIEQAKQLDVKEEKERVNILLMGVDSLEGSKEGIRTDTMMLVSFDPNTKKGSILSIPRDSRVKIRGRNGYDKINAAHAYGGVELAINTVKDLVGVPIHHYVKVDYQALFKTVDDIGGVEIDVPMRMRYRDPYATPPLNINLEKGLQTLDGQKAMQFLRFRKGYVNQDLGRIESQQKFIQAVVDKVMSPSSIVHIGDYIETFNMYVDTDMSKAEMLMLAKDAVGMKKDDIYKAVVPGVPAMISGISYYKVDESGLSSILESIEKGENPSPESNSTKISTTSDSKEETVAPAVREEDRRISVLNGSGRAGVALRASDLLKSVDIVPTQVGNAPNFKYEKTLIYYKNDKAMAEKAKEGLGRGKLIKGTSELDSKEPDIIVVIGKDF